MATLHPKTSGNAKKAVASSPKDTLDWRIKELRAFDVSRIQDRWDPVLESLHKSVNEALAEVLGSNSADYRKFAIETFDATLPSDFGGRYSTEELQRAVRESVAQAIVTLDRVKALVRERSRQTPAAPAAPVAPPAPAVAPLATATPAPAEPRSAPLPAPAAPTPPVPTPARAVAAPPPAAAAVKTPVPPASPIQPLPAAAGAASAPAPARPAVTPPPPAAAVPVPPAIQPAAVPAPPVQPAPAVVAPATQPAAQAPVAPTPSPASVRVAVLGGEAQARRAVLDFILQLGLQPASSAAPAQARLFIDRMDELRDLQYAVVLLPAQSLDAASGVPNAVSPELLMELGHVLATVGRGHVCFLLTSAGKPPAWQGISNLRMDDEGLWHLLLGRAMKQAGLDVDLNRAV